jgi:hypothetical protein
LEPLKDVHDSITSLTKNLNRTNLPSTVLKSSLRAAAPVFIPGAADNALELDHNTAAYFTAKTPHYHNSTSVIVPISPGKLFPASLKPAMTHFLKVNQVSIKSRAHFQPPSSPAMMLQPNCPQYESQNGLQTSWKNSDPNTNFRDVIVQKGLNLVDCYSGEMFDVNHQFPGCLLTSNELLKDIDILCDEKWKMQRADPEQVGKIAEKLAATDTVNTEASPRRWSIAELRCISNSLSVRTLADQIRRESQTIKQREDEGPGPYLHTVPTPGEEIFENQWAPPIGPGHGYQNRNVLPNYRAREWDAIARAIHNSNSASQNKWWEPPIPTGFEHRARFLQPAPQQTMTLRGGFLANEFN